MFVCVCVDMSIWNASQVTHMVKNLPAMQDAQVQSPGWEDPLEKGMAAHFNIFVLEIP